MFDFRKISILIIVACAYLVLPAQRHLKFENVETQLDIAYNSFAQDSLGLMWIGSNNGLCSFDGYTLRTHFDYNSEESTKIHCSLLVGHILYLGTDNGLLIYDTQTDTYVRANVKSPNDIRALAKIGSTIWLGSINGLFLYDTKKENIVEISGIKNSILRNNNIYSIQELKSEVLVGTYDGLYALSKEGTYIAEIQLQSEESKKRNTFVNTLLYDSKQDVLWIGTEGFLFKQTGAGNKIEIVKELSNNSIKTLSIDNHSTLYIGTDNGLFSLTRDNEIAHFVHDSRDEFSLTNNVIWALFRDNANNIWLGTDRGISVLRKNKLTTSIPIHDITKLGDGNVFYSIFKDTKGYYWLGGSNGLIRAEYQNPNFVNPIWYCPNNVAYPLPHGRVRALYEDQNHNIWMASDGSVNLYDYNKKQFRQIILEDSSSIFNSNWAYDVVVDSLSRLWVGSYLGGVLVADIEQLMSDVKTTPHTASQTYHLGNDLLGNSVTNIVADTKGNTWVLILNEGINKIAKNGKDVISYPNSNNCVSQKIIIDKKDNLWVGFNKGIARINSDNSIDTIRFNTSQNLEVFDMVFVDENIWLASSAGLWVVNQQSLKAKALGLDAGNIFSMYFDKEANQLIMGGVNQLIIASPDIVQAKSKQPELVLSEMLVNNIPIDENELSARYLNEMVLEFYQNNLKIFVSELPYLHSRRKIIFYKLKGLEEEWNIVPQNTSTITYNNLKPGSYNLEFAYVDSDGRTSNLIKNLQITIKSPWYLSIGMIIGYIVVLLTLIVWLINFLRVKDRLDYERRERERILQQSTERISFLKDLSNEIISPLGKIITPISKMLNSGEDTTNKILREVHENALLINLLTHRMVNFESTDRLRRELIVSRVNFVKLVEGVVKKFNDTTIKIESETSSLIVEVDVLAWRTMIANLLSNAIKFGQGKPIVVTICYDSKQQELTVKVIDNGIGISEEELPLIATKYFQSKANSQRGTGLGLHIVQSIVDLHNGELKIDSQLGKRTEVMLRVPISAENNELEILTLEPEIESERFIHKITKIVEEHMDDPQLNVSELCSLYDINYKQFYRKLKQITGKTPVEFIKNIRLKRASVLLQNKEFNVSEIMYMVGFSNSSYFSKCFKAEFNTTPIQYREQFLNIK